MTSGQDMYEGRPVVRRVKAGAGWVMVVTGPPLGLATPMVPIGIVIFGAGVGLVVKNSDSGRRFIHTRSRWAARKWPRAYGKMPRKLRDTLSGRG